MRLIILSFTIVFVFLSTKVFSQSTEQGFYIYKTSSYMQKVLAGQGDLTIDHVSKKGFELYGPIGTKAWLDQLNIKYKPLEEIERSIALSYPTYEEIEKKLKVLAQENPDILTLVSIGRSSRGKALWMVKISDNPSVDELEPEFKYIANMHGNEIVGRELMISLVEDLVRSYRAEESFAKNLVNNTEIFIIPSMNPDGAASRQRGNGTSIDLNRNFPDFTTRDNHNTTSGRAPETKAIMELSKVRNFALSANFHGGTEVVNYPWDTTPTAFPLHDLIKTFSLDYASIIPSMYNSRKFKNGITNGYGWYEVNGGMQDWSYYWHNDLQITIELSHRKWPAYHKVANYYKANKASLFNYISKIHQGLGFYYNDKNLTGSILLKKEKASGDYVLFTEDSFKNGEYYKVLPQGNYLLEVTPHIPDSMARELYIQVKKQELLFRPNYTQLFL